MSIDDKVGDEVAAHARRLVDRARELLAAAEAGRPSDGRTALIYLWGEAQAIEDLIDAWRFKR